MITGKKSYMNKNGLVLMKLARELMTYSVGDRLPAIDEYVATYNVSKGTMQAAIKYFCEDAIKLEKLGHLGSFLLEIDYGKVWENTGWNSLVALMPLPQINSLRNLATALSACIEQSGIPFSLAFMQSASNRIRALEASRFDFVIISKLTAETYMTQPDLSIAVELKENSYCQNNIIVFNNPTEKEIRDGMRIAFDPESPDQSLLTQQLCRNKNVEFISMPYRSTLHCLENGSVDAIIYRRESILNSSRNYGITEIPDQDLVKKGSTAVIATNKNNYWINHLLQKIINPNIMDNLHKNIAEGNQYPYY